MRGTEGRYRGHHTRVVLKANEWACSVHTRGVLWGTEGRYSVHHTGVVLRGTQGRYRVHYTGVDKCCGFNRFREIQGATCTRVLLRGTEEGRTIHHTRVE